MLAKVTKSFVIGTVALLLVAATVQAETHWHLQMVDIDGTPNYYKVNADAPNTDNLVVVEGICLNNPEDMLNPASMWQIFVQGEGDDHAGTAAWAGKFYQIDVWDAELARLNASGFREGDRVCITGYAGAVGGKTNIHERHSIAEELNFTVELIEAGVGLPEPEVVTIAEMNTFNFTRCCGGEHYQCRRIRINDVHIVSGTWGSNEDIIIADDDGNELLMALRNVTFGPRPAGKFDVIGLGNQEPEFAGGGPVPGSGLTDSYQIWVTRPDGVVIPEPVSAVMLVLGGMAILRRRRSR